MQSCDSVQKTCAVPLHTLQRLIRTFEWRKSSTIFDKMAHTDQYNVLATRLKLIMFVETGESRTCYETASIARRPVVEAQGFCRYILAFSTQRG